MKLNDYMKDNLRMLIKEKVKQMDDMVVKSVPENGMFDEIRVTFEVHDKGLVADRYWLRVFQPPKGGESWEKERALSFGADKDYSDTDISVLLALGTKQDVLNKLQDPALIDRLIKEVPELSYHLEDL